MLQALRVAIPASLDDRREVSEGYERHEAALIARANGQSPSAGRSRRWQPSATQGPRTSPARGAARKAS